MSAQTKASDAELQAVVTTGDQQSGRLEDWANAQCNTAADDFRDQREESLEYRSLVTQYEYEAGSL